MWNILNLNDKILISSTGYDDCDDIYFNYSNNILI